MKTITLWQPWASLVAVGAKRIETRGWPTKFRGPLAIHAAVDEPSLATCELVGCELVTPKLMAQVKREGKTGPLELEFGDYRYGRYLWLLENVVKLETPITARGRQGMWEFPWPVVSAS